MDLTDFNRIWSAVYGHPAWSVKKGYGSFLTLEFGQPALRIREPRLASPDASEQVRELLGRKEVAHSESPADNITFATQRLDGQKILSVARGTTPGSWVFAFDLGGELKTWPYGEDRSDEQWLLYERDSGDVLSVRADGLCSYGAGSRPSEDEYWERI